MKRRYLKRVAASLIVAALFLGLLKLDAYGGWYAFKGLLRGKGSLWHKIERGGPDNPAWLNAALEPVPPQAQPGKLTLQVISKGAEAGSLPVLVNGTQADKIYLLRFSQAEFSLSVNNNPTGALGIDSWRKTLRAAAVINGSYYDFERRPLTPTVSNGVWLGPTTYNATNGALVNRGGEVRILGLAGKDWEKEFIGATQAFVSYPLLVADGKAVPNKANPEWLANRSFIGIDSEGFILLGTTETGFFSLPRLADFLGRSPLRLSYALNLDGGPVACQAVQFDGFSRSFCGEWEITTRGTELFSLKPVIPGSRWDLPIAIGISRK